MTDALLVSNALLWCMVVALGLVVLALTRQVGLLHERIAPAGALAVAKGPAVGEPAPSMELLNLANQTLAIGGDDVRERRTLLFFLSPTCPVCETLLPTLTRVTREEPRVRVVFASDGERDEHIAFARSHGLDASRYVLSRELGLRFEVAKLPFAVLIDAAGIIRAKGLVNTREHLESLFEAQDRGVASIQEFLDRESPEPPKTRVAGGRSGR